MAFNKLSPKDQAIILSCLTFILNSSFIDDAEFHSRLGIDRRKLNDIIAAFPTINTEVDPLIDITVNNCLNEIVNGLDVPQDDWVKWFKISKEEVKQVYQRWLQVASS